MFQGFLFVLKTRFFQFLSWDYMTRCFTSLLAAWLVLAASFHLIKGQLLYPAVMQDSALWSAFEGYPHFVSFLPVTLTYEIPLTALGIVAQIAATGRKKPGKIGVICVCFWILLHLQCWMRKWKKLEKYISLLDFSIMHVSFKVIIFVIPDRILLSRPGHLTTSTSQLPVNFSPSYPYLVLAISPANLCVYNSYFWCAENTITKI
jgi:hypothetical protein